MNSVQGVVENIGIESSPKKTEESIIILWGEKRESISGPRPSVITAMACFNRRAVRDAMYKGGMGSARLRGRQ